MECSCKNLKPIFWENPESEQLEVDVLVCQDCLKEYCVSSLTKYEYFTVIENERIGRRKLNV